MHYSLEYLESLNKRLHKRLVDLERYNFNLKNHYLVSDVVVDGVLVYGVTLKDYISYKIFHPTLKHIDIIGTVRIMKGTIGITKGSDVNWRYINAAEKATRQDRRIYDFKVTCDEH